MARQTLYEAEAEIEGDGQEDGFHRTGLQQAAADSRVPNLRVCKHLGDGVAHAE